MGESGVIRLDPLDTVADFGLTIRRDLGHGACTFRSRYPSCRTGLLVTWDVQYDH